MNDYIKEMRKYIGHRPLLLCGSSVIIFNDCGKVLMLHRNDNDSWCFPGGAVELGENVEFSAQREVFEETGLDVTDLKLFGVFSGEKLHYIYPNGDEVYIVDIVFITSTFKGELIVKNESRTGCFFPINELPEEIGPPVMPVVKELKKRYAEGVHLFFRGRNSTFTIWR